MIADTGAMCQKKTLSAKASALLSAGMANNITLDGNVAFHPCIMTTLDPQWHHLETRIAYHFKDKKRLQQAMTHRGYDASSSHNERLEFLGDALLSLIISDYLFDQHPDADEGTLTQLRKQIVQGKNLSQLAKHFELHKVLRRAYHQQQTPFS